MLGRRDILVSTGGVSDVRNIIVGVVVAVVVAWFVGYTTPGHRMLNALGFTTACDYGCS